MTTINLNMLDTVDKILKAVQNTIKSVSETVITKLRIKKKIPVKHGLIEYVN